MRTPLSMALLCAAAAAGPVEEAADAVLASRDESVRQRAIAEKDEPDPWLVAEELCARGEHEAALAFAGAAPRPATERLPAYVAARRDRPDPHPLRSLPDEQGQDPAATLAQLEGARLDAGDVPCVRLLELRGLALRHLGKPRESAEALLAAAAAAERIGWWAGASGALQEAGLSRYRAGDPAAAREAWKRALVLEERCGNRWGVARMHSSLGVLASRRDEYDAALAHHRRALRLFEEIDDGAGVAKALGDLGIAYRAQGDVAKAREHMLRALAMQEETGDRAGAAITLGNLGNLCHGTGELRQALAYHERSLEIERDLGNERGVAETRSNLGLVHLALADYDRAQECYESALAFMERAGDAVGAGIALENLGRIYTERGDTERSLVHLRRAERLFREAGQRGKLANCLDALAKAHAQRGEGRLALEYQRQCLELTAELGMRVREARALSFLGALHIRVGECPAALHHLEAAARRQASLEDPLGAAATLANLAVVYEDLGQYERALAAHRRALAVFEKSGDRRSLQGVLGNLGSASERLGDLEAARQHYERSLRIAEETGNRPAVASVLSNLGIVLRRLGDSRAAVEHQQRALRLAEEIGDRAGIARVLVSLGNLHEDQREYAAARAHHERALSVARTSRVPGTEQRALWGLARVDLARGDPAGAAARIRTAVRDLPALVGGLSTESGTTVREAWSSIVDTGIRAALRLGDPAEVSFFLEAGRAGALLEALGDESEGRAVPPALLAEDAAARSAVAVARRKVADGESLATRRAARAGLDTAERALLDIVARIQRESKSVPAARAEPAPLATIRAELPAGTTFVAYGHLSDAFFAVVADRAGARVVDLGPPEALDGMPALEDWKPDRPWTAEVAAARRLLVAPLGLPRDVRRVVVMPQGRLSYMPFALLVPGSEVSHVASGTMLGVLRARSGVRGEAVLALGDPDYGGGETPVPLATLLRGGRLTPLPGTRAEAEAVGDVVLLGERATVPGFLAALAGRPRWRAVHLACHGLLHGTRPRLSALVLTPGGGHDGYLTALDVARTRIAADLVVLSACQTGKGAVYRSEGVVGFTQAFLRAGALRVIVSLWKVDDAATRALMEKFYELWRSHPTATALKKAQEHVASHPKWRHPRYWAAWQLWGLPE